MKTLPLGPLVTYTDSSVALLICIAVLNQYAPARAEAYNNKPAIKSLGNGEKTGFIDNIKLKSLFDGVIKDLNRYSPIFTYFGHHPSSPLTLGVWPDHGAIQKAEDSYQITKTYNDILQKKHYSSAYILHISDCLTLYRTRDMQIIWQYK